MATVRAKKKRTKAKRVSRTSKKAKDSISAKDLIPADYNPRVMDAEARKGLKKSMDEFNDISGITWNKVTKNIVTGHHRWENLIDSYGIENLEFDELKGGRFAIIANGQDTGFTMKIVEWDEDKEKAANITANSHKIEGQFTPELTNILGDLKMNLGEDMFSDLRLDDLKFEFQYLSDTDKGSAGDDDWETDIEAVKKVEEDEHQEKPEYSQIIITCRTDQKADMVEIIKEALEDEKFEIN
jgi:hypothetical protein